jgi:sRNA-binding protein
LLDELMKAELGFPKSCVRITLKHIVKREAYQTALAAGGSRYDLDGRPRGEVSPAARAEAEVRLAQLRAKAAQEEEAERSKPAPA